MNEIIKKAPFWMFLSVILLIALVLSFSQEAPHDKGEIKGKEEIGEITTEYINNVLLQEGESVELIEVSEERGFYRVRVRYNLEEIDSYVSKDGRLFFSEALDMKESFPKIFEEDKDEDKSEDESEDENKKEELDKDKTVEEENDSEELDDSENNDNDNNNDDEIGALIECLKKENFIIYGANWCPYCRDIVNLFEGHEKVDLIYVECTENESICRQENITAYPTVRIDGENYRGERSLESFSDAAGC